jgi:hypothetical protein
MCPNQPPRDDGAWAITVVIEGTVGWSDVDLAYIRP